MLSAWLASKINVTVVTEQVSLTIGGNVAGATLGLFILGGCFSRTEWKVRRGEMYVCTVPVTPVVCKLTIIDMCQYALLKYMKM